MDTIPDVLDLKVVTSAERETYRHRQEDQYGLIEESWPRVGMRVPYDPESYSSMEPRRSLAAVSEKKIVQSIHNLIQPVVDLGDWDGGQAGSSGIEGVESDDEGALFCEAYLEGSGTRGDDHDPEP
jgi:hypothetical protein